MWGEFSGELRGLNCAAARGLSTALVLPLNERGLWVLPTSRPDAQVSEALEESLARRLDVLSSEARELARCLSLQRVDPTLELCRRLVGEHAQRGVLALFDELAENDVLHWTRSAAFSAVQRCARLCSSAWGHPRAASRIFGSDKPSRVSPKKATSRCVWRLVGT